MREQFLEERLVRIEAEIAGLSEIAHARTIASVDMRPRICFRKSCMESARVRAPVQPAGPGQKPHSTPA